MNYDITREIEIRIQASEKSAALGEIADAWRSLEEAHILSQAFAWKHTLVHFRMLMLGAKLLNARECVGQLFRLLVAAPASLIGRYPSGNTGRSNVSAFMPMQISDNLAKILRRK